MFPPGSLIARMLALQWLEGGTPKEGGRKGGAYKACAISHTSVHLLQETLNLPHPSPGLSWRSLGEAKRGGRKA